MLTLHSVPVELLIREYTVAFESGKIFTEDIVAFHMDFHDNRLAIVEFGLPVDDGNMQHEHLFAYRYTTDVLELPVHYGRTL